MNPIELSIRRSIAGYLDDGALDDGAAGPAVASDTDLLTLLDSLQILRMLLDLEAEYSIKVENSELTPENLGTIGRLTELIDRKQRELAV
jgi:acyl carrier protein